MVDSSPQNVVLKGLTLQGYHLVNPKIARWAKPTEKWDDTGAFEAFDVRMHFTSPLDYRTLLKAPDALCLCPTCRSSKELVFVLQDPSITRSPEDGSPRLYAKAWCPDGKRFVGQFESLLDSSSLFGPDEDARVARGPWKIF